LGLRSQKCQASAIPPLKERIIMKSSPLNRRDFLRLSIVFSLSPLFPIPCFALEGAAWKDSYYKNNSRKFTDDFEIILDAVRDQYIARFGEDDADLFIRRARGEFPKVLQRLPPIGGEKNPDMKFLLSGAQYLAMYIPMKERAVPADVLGRIMYDMVSRYFSDMPEEERNRERDLFFGEASIARMSDWAASTLERYYAADWVCEFVQGDWETFDFGYDMKECAILKLFCSENIQELMPYFCCTDFPRSAAIGTGLVREKSLGFGDECCNFRYRKGRKVRQSWDTEVPRLNPPSA